MPSCREPCPIPCNEVQDKLGACVSFVRQVAILGNADVRGQTGIAQLFFNDFWFPFSAMHAMQPAISLFACRDSDLCTGERHFRTRAATNATDR